MIVSTIQNVHSRMYRAEFPRPLARLGLLLDRLNAPLATRLVAVSHGVHADLIGAGIPREKIHVIHNSLDLRRCKGLPACARVRAMWGVGGTELVIGTAALLRLQKGLFDLLDAARLLATSQPNLRFLLFGDGPLRADVERRLTMLGIHGRVQIMGWTDDVVKILPGIDVYGALEAR